MTSKGENDETNNKRIGTPGVHYSDDGFSILQVHFIGRPSWPMIHQWAGYYPIAGTKVDCLLGGSCSQPLNKRPMKQIRLRFS